MARTPCPKCGSKVYKWETTDTLKGLDYYKCSKCGQYFSLNRETGAVKAQGKAGKKTRPLVNIFVGQREDLRELSRQESPEEYEEMEKMIGEGKTKRAGLKRWGLYSRGATRNKYIKKIENKIIEIAILWIAGGLSIIFGFPFLGAGLILISFYVILPDEYEIIEDARPKKEESEESEEEGLREEFEQKMEEEAERHKKELEALKKSKEKEAKSHGDEIQFRGG